MKPEDRGHAATPASVLLVAFDIAAGMEGEFNRWYDQTHLPEMLAQRGIRSARRFEAAQAPTQHLTIYEIDDPAVLEAPEFVAWRDGSASTRAMRVHALNFQRAVYRPRPAPGAPERGRGA